MRKPDLSGELEADFQDIKNRLHLFYQKLLGAACKSCHASRMMSANLDYFADLGDEIDKELKERGFKGFK